MGAGRKTETAVLQNKLPPLWKPNTYPTTARSLRKADFAGVIFGCKHSTFKECIFKQLFGLPAQHFQYVQNITQGMPLFLFNYSDWKLHGVFEALFAAKMNINPHAWTLDGQEMTPFPAQVRVKIHMQWQPLNEDRYKPIVADNDRPHEPTHFWFGLDKAQTEKLISLLSASPLSQSLATPLPTTKWGNLFRQSIAAVTHKKDLNSRKTNLDVQLGSALSSAELDKRTQKSEAASDQEAIANQVNVSASFEEKAWISLFNSQSDSMPNMDGDSMDEDLEVHVPHQDPFSMLGQSSCPQLSAKKET